MNHNLLSQKLLNLGRKIPKEWKEKGVKEIDINREQREKMEKMYYNGKVEKVTTSAGGRTINKEDRKLGDKERQMLGKILKSGQFDKKKQEMDPKSNEKIGRAWDEILRAARARGDIPSVKEARKDYERFMASRK